MQIDVFTLVPHAFAWLTEQRPVAAVLGAGLDLRLFNYRDTTPLRAGQVDDEPYGGGAGMVLRVDVVAAALEAVYGGEPPGRVVAFTPQGRQLEQALVEELAAEPRLTLLSARFEGFDERVVEHLATDVVSVVPYVLSNGDLPAMLLVDAEDHPRSATVRLVVDLPRPERCRVAVVEQAQVEPGPEHGRDRPLLGQPRKGVRHKGEDVDLHGDGG